MLEAESLGISSCIIGAFGSEITGILPDVYAKTKKELNLKDSQIISTIITLGYEETPTQAEKKRKEFDEVVFFEKLPNPPARH